MSGALLALANTALAFSDPSIYGKYATERLGGGGNRFFTGSPADGYNCSVCHTAPVAYSFPLYQTGLPPAGYVPGTTYNVTLAWPEAATWAASHGTPMTALTAEFIAEDAGNSGVLQLMPAEFVADALERCAPRPGEIQGELAANLQAVKPGLDTTPIIDAAQPCDTSLAVGSRCVLTVKPCSTSRVQVRWTAPLQWRGPIWFSASLVATDITTGKPNDFDYVSELTLPIQQATDGASYEDRLASGCSAVGPKPANQRSSWAGMMLLVVVSLGLRRRVRLAADGGRLLALTLLTMLGGCADAAAPGDTAVYAGPVGAFEPGDSTVLDAGAGAGAGLMCTMKRVAAPLGLDLDAGASELAGTLNVSFTTAGPTPGFSSQWDLKSATGTTMSHGAIWIEDASGAFVKTLEFWGSNYTFNTLAPYVMKWFNCGKTDAVAKATISAHQVHTLMWSGEALGGFVAPDGDYVLWIDVQVDEQDWMPVVQVPFKKGRAPWSMTLPDAPPHAGLKLDYVPTK